MRERPILFSGPMVRAILAGRKTVTRRVVRPQLPDVPKQYGFVGLHEARAEKTNPFRLDWPVGEFVVSGAVRAVRDAFGGTIPRWMSPYGVAGDRLWVRETWSALGNDDGAPVDKAGEVASWGPGVACVYRADATRGPYGADVLPDGSHWFHRWRPSIHMPRWASRITLEVGGVRVERLWDITEEDARAEGVPPNWSDDLSRFVPEEHGWLTPAGARHVQEHPEDDCDEGGCVGGEPAYVFSAREAFALWWDHINGKRAPWECNPWVWRVEFRAVPS